MIEYNPTSIIVLGKLLLSYSPVGSKSLKYSSPRIFTIFKNSEGIVAYDITTENLAKKLDFSFVTQVEYYEVSADRLCDCEYYGIDNPYVGSYDSYHPYNISGSSLDLGITAC